MFEIDVSFNEYCSLNLPLNTTRKSFRESKESIQSHFKTHDFIPASPVWNWILKIQFYKNQFGRCDCCNIPMILQYTNKNESGTEPMNLATWEHIHPRNRGGSNKLSNITLTCLKCNSRRGSMNYGLFKYLTQKNMVDTVWKYRKRIADKVRRPGSYPQYIGYYVWAHIEYIVFKNDYRNKLNEVRLRLSTNKEYRRRRTAHQKQKRDSDGS